MEHNKNYDESFAILRSFIYLREELKAAGFSNTCSATMFTISILLEEFKEKAVFGSNSGKVCELLRLLEGFSVNELGEIAEYLENMEPQNDNVNLRQL